MMNPVEWEPRYWAEIWNIYGGCSNLAQWIIYDENQGVGFSIIRSSKGLMISGIHDHLNGGIVGFVTCESQDF